MKKILLVGGNGALGVYLREEALKAGFAVDVVCMEDEKADNPNLRFIKHDGMDLPWLRETVKAGYDAIVDFMVYYPTVDVYKPYADMYLAATPHYLFLSTYRVYGGGCPVTEETLRICDMDLPADFVKHGEYSYYKGQEEDYLRASGKKNYTIIRPTITFSKHRFQLTILEANILVWRMRHGKTVVLPKGAMDHEATLSWAGEFGKCVVKLLCNEAAFGEAFTVGTAEHHTWREMAELYKKLEGLKYIEVPDDIFINECCTGAVGEWQQLRYDRCYDRIIDNSKILKYSGRKQSDFLSLEDALKMELSQYDGSLYDKEANDRMDACLAKLGISE